MVRIQFIVVGGALVAASFAVCGQQAPSTSGNVLTPEQRAYQQQGQAWFARHQSLQAQATPGPTGATLTAQQSIAEFNHIEQLWQQYRDATCTAGLHQFDGGTGGPGFQTECELKLARDQLRELNSVYSMLLHL
jgi:Lysozyme inhibitor LprI